MDFDQTSRDRALGALFRDREPLLTSLHDHTMPIRQYRSLQMGYVKSEASRLFAASKALPYTASDAEIQAVANAINPHTPSDEVIPWRRKRKSSGKGDRLICELPPIIKAEHYLARDLVCAAMPVASHIYDVRGRGTSAAIAAIRNALEEGCDWCWVGDIRDCFQSVLADALIPLLPLPRSVVSNWLNYQNLTLSPEPMVDDGPSTRVLYVAEAHRRNRPRGLLQGSPASNSVLAMLLSSLSNVFDLHECVACLFADNLFVAAKSKAERDAVVTEISDHLIAHPAGRFRLHKQRYISPNEQFEALGWVLQQGAEVEPTFTAMDRMWGKLAKADDADTLRADGTIACTRRIVNGYAGSFKGWPEAGDLLEGAVLRAQAFTDIATTMRLATASSNTDN